MISADSVQKDAFRASLVLLAMYAALAFLGLNLWRIQVVNGSSYRSNVDRQSMRRVRLPAARGAIFDRHGICLAENRPGYALAIYAEELRRPGRWENTVERIDGVVDELAGILGLERALSRDDIRMHIRRRLPLPLLAWRNLSPEAMARWAESPRQFPGVDLQEETLRFYPLGSRAAHVLGYVGRADDEDAETDPATPYHYYLPAMKGKYGIEREYDNALAGVAGGQLIRVDASGFRYNEVSEREPIPGEDLHLTLDADLQRLAEEAISDRRGAVVVLDPNSGDVLALAGAPTFDPNLFAAPVASGELASLQYDEGRPFFSRAVTGTYPPGSIFKPVVAVAALEAARITADTLYSCPGYFELGGARFRCWNSSGHGTLALRKAIEQSCNAYFCQAGLQCGYEVIYQTAQTLGLGRKTGIELPGESRGLLPDNRWKQQHLGDSWRGGDTCNVSIGQGALLVTPLQMAVLASALANGGRVYRPRLVLRPGVPGEEVNRLAWSPATRRVVRGGMYDVVESPTGTGKRARVDGFAMGGKTGTAEFGPRSHRRKYAWMIAFAPFEQPRYAMAMVIEDAISGGVDVAPRIHKFMAGAFGVTPPPDSHEGDDSSVMD